MCDQGNKSKPAQSVLRHLILADPATTHAAEPVYVLLTRWVNPDGRTDFRIEVVDGVLQATLTDDEAFSTEDEAEKNALERFGTITTQWCPSEPLIPPDRAPAIRGV